MVLHGWKQIAQYLGCGIRTAQRWEAQCGMPVNRPRHHLRSPVLAQSEALDEWASGAPAPAASGTDGWDLRWETLSREIAELKREVELLSSRYESGGDLHPGTAAQAPERPRPAGAKAASFDA